MRAGWNLPLVLNWSFLCGQSLGFWSLGVFAKTDAQESLYPDASAKRIAIIGAGAAGASTAYHLQQFASQSGLSINVTVYERSCYIGGRTTTVNAYNDPLTPVELGASIFVEVNEILKNASTRFGLKPRVAESEEAEMLGVWNGERFVFTQKEGGWYWLDVARLIWRYGFAPLRTQRLMKSTIGKFRKLYAYPFFPFRSLSDRALDLDLISVTSLTGEQLLAANGIGPPFSTDIIQASTRVNYGQNLNLILETWISAQHYLKYTCAPKAYTQLRSATFLHEIRETNSKIPKTDGLETLVCMAIEGAMQIEGGNWQIFDNMLKFSNATILLNTTVNGVSKKNGRYSITTSSKDANLSNEESFDTVVLAAPFQYSGLQLEEGLLKHTPDNIPYVRLHVTLFTSTRTLNPLYFNLAPGEDTPTTILTTLRPDEIPEEGAGSTGFFSISTLRTLINPKSLEKEHLYKIFSPQKVTSEFLSDILAVPIPTNLSAVAGDSGDGISWYYPHVFFSYPYEYPRVSFEEIELARGFYYTSGIESFISTMETSALSGMNVAQLIVDDYLQVPAAHCMNHHVEEKKVLNFQEL